MNKERDERICRAVRTTAVDLIKSPSADVNQLVIALTNRIMEICGNTAIPRNVMEALVPKDGVWGSRILLPLLEKLNTAYQARPREGGTLRVQVPCVIGGVTRNAEIFITQRDRNSMQAMIYFDRNSDFAPRLLFYWAVKGTRYPTVEYDLPSHNLRNRNHILPMVHEDTWFYDSREAQNTAAEEIITAAITKIEKGEYD